MTTQITPHGLPLSGNNERGKKTEGARSSSCSFFVVGYPFLVLFFFFFFILMSDLHSVLDFYVKQKWPAQHMVWMCRWDPLAKPKVKEDEAAPAAGPLGAAGTTGCR